MSPIDNLCLRLWRAQWLPQRINRSLYKHLARRDLAPDAPFSVDFFGLRYDGNLKINIDFHIYDHGAFEKPLLFVLRDAMQQLAAEEAVFVDVGANVGQHSLFMSRIASQVHAFEPFAPVRERLQHQIEINKLKHIKVHPVGLSDRNVHMPFFAPTGRNMGIGSFDASTTSKGNVSIGDLELVRGDDYFLMQGIVRIDLLKMDVEGFEKPALHGLRETLRRLRPLIVCEITYGKELSFTSRQDLLDHLPPDYELFTFDKRKADGSKARRRDASTRNSGKYRLIAYRDVLQTGQDDIIACPRESLEKLQLTGSQ